MKICIATGIFPPDIGGPATYSSLLLAELPKRDIEVEVVTYGEPEAGDTTQHITRVSRRLPKGIRHCIYLIRLLQRAWSADIVFAQDLISAGLPALLAATLLRKKFYIKIVGDYAWEQGVQRFNVQELPDQFQKQRYGLRVEFLRFIQLRVAKQAQKVFVPSQYLKTMVENWGLNSERIFVILNSTYPLHARGNKSAARSLLKIQGTILVSIGRLVPWKGFEMLIRVIAEVRQEFNNLHLFIIGDGPDRLKLEKVVKELHLTDGIHFTGSVSKDDVISYLRAADLFVLNTGYEGLSHQIREAKSYGLPVITTNVGGNAEIVNDGTSGLLIPYNSHEALKQAIIKVLSDEDLQRKLGDWAWKQETTYTYQMMITQYVESLCAS